MSVIELTEPEKAAARAFRDRCQAELDRLNDDEPADIMMPVLLHHVRHVCPVLGKSVSFEMKEVYQTSEDGRFGFIYREGRCSDCKITGRSRKARLVDATTRPPLGRS